MFESVVKYNFKVVENAFWANQMTVITICSESDGQVYPSCRFCENTYYLRSESMKLRQRSFLSDYEVFLQICLNQR